MMSRLHTEIIPATSVDNMITDTEQQIQQLQLKLTWLKEMRTKARPAGPLHGPGENGDLPEGGQLGPRAGVRWTLRNGPRSPGEIIESLRGHIKTKARDIDSTLYSTMSNMKAAGEVRKRSDGRYELIQQE